MRKPVDKIFLLSIILLIVGGFFIFSSASLGLLSKGGVKYSNVVSSQLFGGMFIGTIAMIWLSQINYKLWRRNALWIFIVAIIANLLVFTGIGFEHGGASRWIMIFGYSFQPSELLKIAFIIYFASWLSGIKDKVQTVKYGLLPFTAILGIVGLLLLLQPDTDTFAVIIASGFAMFLVAGGRWKHLLMLGIVLISILVVVAMFRPYVKDRLVTFLNPEKNGQTSSYQIQQSLIAVGSGGIVGNGFGQSVQKFGLLPEPIGDSIFAVAAEEFGFIGSIFIIILFLFFMLRGLKIAIRTEDSFGRLFVVGTVILIVSQAFVNIGAMIGMLPLSGITLPFVSHGGTALLINLAEMGIILNISRQRKS